MKNITKAISLLLVFSLTIGIVISAAADTDNSKPIATATDAENKVPFELISVKSQGKDLDGATLSYSIDYYLTLVFSCPLDNNQEMFEIIAFYDKNGLANDYIHSHNEFEHENGTYVFIVNICDVPKGNYKLVVKSGTRCADGDELGKDCEFSFSTEERTALWTISNILEIIRDLVKHIVFVYLKAFVESNKSIIDYSNYIDYILYGRKEYDKIIQEDEETERMAYDIVQYFLTFTGLK